MARHHYWKYILDTAGNIVESANINIFKANTATPATIYTAESGGSEVNATPQRTSDSKGYFEFWIDDTIYNQHQEFKLEIIHSQLQNTIIDYVTIPRSSSGWKKMSSSYTAIPGDKLLVDTTDHALTLTLPKSPTLGDDVEIMDCVGNFNASNLTATGNGEYLRGSSGELVATVDWVQYKFVYVDATTGWAY